MNKVFMVGNLGRDSDLKFLQSGTAVAKFSIAVKRIKKDDPADFFNCVWFGKGAESCSQYLVKGTKVAISGHLQTGSYEAKDGHKVYTTDVIVENLEFCGSKKNEDTEQNNSYDNTFNEDVTVVDGGDIPF